MRGTFVSSRIFATCTVYPRVCGGTAAALFQIRTLLWVYPRVCGGTAGVIVAGRKRQA